MQWMTDKIHHFAVEPASDGKFYLLFKRKAVEGVPGFAAWRYPENKDGSACAFESDEAVRAFAKTYLGATDEEFASHPGRL